MSVHQPPRRQQPESGSEFVDGTQQSPERKSHVSILFIMIIVLGSLVVSLLVACIGVRLLHRRALRRAGASEAGVESESQAPQRAEPMLGPVQEEVK
jgi:flagellar biosynthesis/type III secretory pathway M-ring protein FliF/YscJ